MTTIAINLITIVIKPRSKLITIVIEMTTIAINAALAQPPRSPRAAPRSALAQPTIAIKMTTIAINLITIVIKPRSKLITIVIELTTIEITGHLT